MNILRMKNLCVKLNSFLIYKINLFTYLLCNLMNRIVFEFLSYGNQSTDWPLSQLTFTCSKSTIETLKKGVKYVERLL